MPTTPKAGAVLYAKDMPRVAAFYADVAALKPTHADASHTRLESAAWRLTVHAIPAHIAATFTIASPPEVREEAAVKLSFEVASLADARAAAARLGGALNPPDREWVWDGQRICDGHDPEGNVFQLGEPAATP